MSYRLITAALVKRLSTMSSPLPTQTAWENVAFDPPAGIYQRAFILPSATSNPTYGDTLQRETGIFQVSIYAPNGNGSGDAIERADIIRDWFYRGLSLVNDTVTVRIIRTPSIAPAIQDDLHYIIPVSIPYFCDVF